MPSTLVVELQQKLFKRMGLDAPGLAQVPNSNRRTGVPKGFSRKDKRKAERAQKKTQRYSRQTQLPHTARPTHDFEHAEEEALPESNEQVFGSDNYDPESTQQEPSPPPSNEPERRNGLSKSMRERLAQDDAEIEALERKLGIKKHRKSLPKAFQDDGLDEILGNTGGGVSDSDDESNKRKRDFDDWLSSKRRRTISKPDGPAKRDGNTREQDSNHDDFPTDSDENDGGDSDDESFKSFKSDGDAAVPVQPRQRENPYVAPTTGVVVAKYIPPSRRMAPASGDEARDRLQKQIQGQINRLTDSNILSIVQSIDDIYQHNARGDVTELLTDAIMAQVCRPESLPDQFFVLTGGFSAAVYKIIGSSFGSHLARRVVKEFGDAYGKASQETDDQGFHRKETSNLVTFLTQLYMFEVVGCRILFDYMERLLKEITEVNVELLVRMCRMAGRLLRRDDPQALKHVSGTLSQAVSKVGYANVSARTKFMIEIINDLKNGKPKAKGLDSAVVSEHVLRMRKRLGDLKSQSRRLDGLAAMGMGLDDIEGADTHGKWWLVGASVPVYREVPERAKSLAKTRTGGDSDTTDDEDMDFVLPDYPSKARAQGLGTGAQISIFTALMSANSHEQGYQQYAKLKLKKDEQLEVARVLVQCVGSEMQYNEYYGLVGSLACANGRVRFAFQNRLWKLFRGLGESLFGEGADEEETADSERMQDERRAGHVARFYASLVANGALSISILKPLQLPELNRRTSAFVERFMVSLLQECRGKRAVGGASVEKAFGPAKELPSLAAGIYWFLSSKVRKSKLVEAKEAKGLVRVREKAQTVVQAATADDGC
ncbi:MIF4G domain-containing protein [Hirsutella rhossiliensis]|uniref:MIF4G domain-containing protein n=1 Tax=Hirsutella rhossiliensis TaxID=111463 RepID=A0A9P8MN09_9HYPO|nr:MIF4G domain-containing protein [Hirsutella rhossiliensis]KAH0957967.1 MIF4G domain-containing protein [Hirsutella rhossiliensis]